MPNVAAVLKEEITRLARKETRRQIEPLKKTIAEQRASIAALKRQVAALERGQSGLARQAAKTSPQASAAAASTKQVRFSPKWVKADRKRLGLSARQYSLLVGVSMLTIYNWESGKSKPQAGALAKWASVRGMGRREALKRLEVLDK